MESHRFLLAIVVLGVILAMLMFSRPSITGFVPTETYTQQLNIDIDESQRFVLSSEDNAPLRLSSLSLAGIVKGNGLVNVYLSDGSKQWLVFSNRKKQGSSMEQITGMAVKELNFEPGQKLGIIESLPEGYVTSTGAFQNTCIETCILDGKALNLPSLYLDVIIEPGTVLHISALRFSVSGE